jgi:hypothetical protein
MPEHTLCACLSRHGQVRIPGMKETQTLGRRGPSVPTARGCEIGGSSLGESS